LTVAEGWKIKLRTKLLEINERKVKSANHDPPYTSKISATGPHSQRPTNIHSKIYY
jgi:hypothetical protein